MCGLCRSRQVCSRDQKRDELGSMVPCPVDCDSSGAETSVAPADLKMLDSQRGKHEWSRLQSGLLNLDT